MRRSGACVRALMRHPVCLITLAALALAEAPSAAQTPAPRPPMIPQQATMREMTPAEDSANRIWNLRAALNVAALQCQFSPFLMTVRNYNDGIRHHAKELDAARVTLASHFKRHDGAGAQRSFDQYTTRTYNSFSTLDAQLSFCDKAAEIGRVALAARKGAFGTVAAQYLPELRASLIPQFDPLTRVELGWVTVPQLIDPCLDRKGRRKKRC